MEMRDRYMSRAQHNKGLVIWLTGLSGAGKTTLARSLSGQLTGGVEVESFSVSAIGTGVGLMGLLYRLTIQYRGEDAVVPVSANGPEPAHAVYSAAALPALRAWHRLL